MEQTGSMLIRVKTMNGKEGKSCRVTILRIFAFEIGMHDVNGVHLNAGFGLGPCELSLTLHTWEKW